MHLNCWDVGFNTAFDALSGMLAQKIAMITTGL
jgi:hypothetical protein